MRVLGATTMGAKVDERGKSLASQSLMAAVENTQADVSPGMAPERGRE
jgi:hypothetical protein